MAPTAPTDQRVLFFGDSFVAGVGDPEALGWVGRVVAGRPGLTAYNLGVRRETSEQVAARMGPEAAPRLAEGADCRLVVSFGANDATWEDGRVRVEPDAGVRALERAIELGWPVLVIGPPPVADEAQADRIAALSERFAAVCDEHGVPFVETAGALRGGGPWLPEARAGDGAHPGAGGYAQLAQLVRAPFIEWLRRGMHA